MYFVQADRPDYLRLERDLKPVLKKQSTEACLFGLTILFLLLRTLLGCVEHFFGVWNCSRSPCCVLLALSTSGTVAKCVK